MSITDELRRVAAKTECANGRCEKLYRGDIDHIADRIDAEHEKSKGCIYYDRERHYCSCHDIDANGYTALPLDADGVPIHIGDVMENIVCPSVHREVTGVGVECFYGWDEGNGRYSQFGANCYRHHHAPTVEDVLREFAYGLGVPVADSYVAATAAKLRLAEGSE